MRALRNAKLAKSARTPGVNFTTARDGKRIVQAQVDLLDQCRAEKLVHLGHFFVCADCLGESELAIVTAAPNIQEAFLGDAGRVGVTTCYLDHDFV